MLVTLLLAVATPAGATTLDYPTEEGYVHGQWADAGGSVFGFSVDDGEGIAFWQAYRRLGGRTALGPALSHRYPCGGSVCQAFERAVLRWDPERQQAEAVPVLSFLHHTGRDGLVAQRFQLPSPWDWSSRDAGKDWAAVLEDHDGLYSASAGLRELRERLGARRETVVGLPVAVEQTRAGTVLRGTHGAVIDPPTVGDDRSAYVLGAGNIALAAGMVPAWALEPHPMRPSVAQPPSALWIPRLNLNSGLISLDPEQDGSLPAPEEPEQVAWYTHSARLGEGGNAVIAAHVDWVGRVAAFRHLPELQPGDQVWLFDPAGRAVEYRVAETAWYHAESGTLRRMMGNPEQGPSTLTLVTCGGPFDVATRTYLERFVVRAVPVE